MHQLNCSNNKTVHWLYPERPVLPSFLGNRLVPDKPAECSQIRETVIRAGKLAGITAQIVGHDLRRGAAADIALIKEPDQGFTTMPVAMSLGHSRKSHSMGTTDKYAGSTQHDFWLSRVKEQPVNLDAPSTANSYIERKLNSDDVSAKCVLQGLDINNKNDRKNTARAMRRENFEKWVYGNPDDNHLAEAIECMIGGDVSKSSLALTGDDLIDPLLLAPAASPDVGSVSPDVVSKSSIEFVDYLSRINIVRMAYGSQSGKQRLTYLEGGSRSPPQLFQSACVNTRFGCSYSINVPSKLTFHESHCPYTSHEAAARLAAVKTSKPFACVDCTGTYLTADGLSKHRRSKHATFVAVSCGGDTDNCDPDMIFTTAQALLNHKNRYHFGKLGNVKCSFPGCKRSKRFDHISVLRTHLKVVHKLRTEDISKYTKDVHNQRIKRYERQKCPLREAKIAKSCESVWSSRSKLTAHLESKSHQLSLEEIERLVPILGGEQK